MNLLTFLSILLIIASSTSQNITVPTFLCNYANTASGYVCNLEADNIDGSEDLNFVYGDHLEGMTDSDVVSINRLGGITFNIPEVFCRKFPNTEVIDFSNFGVTQIDENSFAGCRNLAWLRLMNNGIMEIPPNTFVENSQLIFLDLNNNQINEIPVGLFASLVNLEILELKNNFISVIPNDVFSSQEKLLLLLMDNMGLTHLNPAWFAPLINLQQLNLYYNSFTEIPENAFSTLRNLRNLDISYNLVGIERIHSNAFNSLTNLVQINLNNAGLQEIDPAWFSATTRLTNVYLNFNRIQEIPTGTFSQLAGLRLLHMWQNELKVIRRGAFGYLGNLDTVDFERNSINAMDESIFEDAAALRILYFSRNICASGSFFDFANNRATFLPRLQRCFCNIRYYVDIATTPDDDFRIFQALNPGFIVRVNASSDVQIALLPVSQINIPRIEIFIGIANNTRSVIRRNGATPNVVDISTPNILNVGRWNDFRVIWVNFMVLVFRGGEEFPFMVWNMNEFWPINNYAVRSPGNQANWIVQPLEFTDDLTC